MSDSAKDSGYYVLAAILGTVTGCADVAVNDLLFTALLVLASCILLACCGRAGRGAGWYLSEPIPLTELAAYWLLTVKPSRAQIYGSFLAFLPGIAGAYGGSLMRGVIENLRQGK